MSQIKKESGVRKIKRGTQNELEIVGIIVMDNHLLRKRVLDLLKKAKQNYIKNLSTKPKQDLAS